MDSIHFVSCQQRNPLCKSHDFLNALLLTCYPCQLRPPELPALIDLILAAHNTNPKGVSHLEKNIQGVLFATLNQ